MKITVKQLYWYLLIFHAIGINMVFAIATVLMQDIVSIYEFFLLWFFSCQLNSFGFYCFNKAYPNEASASFSKEISFIDFVSFIKKMIHPFQVGNINGKPFFIVVIIMGYAVFVLFFIVSLLNIFYDVFPLTLEQNLYMYGYVIVLSLIISGFKKSLSIVS